MRKGRISCVAHAATSCASDAGQRSVRIGRAMLQTRCCETSARLLRLLSLLQAAAIWTGRRAGRAARGRARGRSAATSTACAGSATRSHAAPGVAGGYRLGAGAALPPLLLDDDEAVAVAVGLRTAAGGAVAGIEETSVRALAKLEQVLPARLRRRVTALQDVTVPFAGRRRRPSTPAVLTGDRRRLPRPRAAALRLPRPRRQRRAGAAVEPHRLVHTGRRWYLVGLGLPTRGLAHLPRRPRRPAAADRPAVHPADAAVPRRRRLCRAVDLVTAPPVPGEDPAARAADRRSRTGSRTTWGRSRRSTTAAACCSTGRDSLGGLAVYVADIGVDFTVLEPPELVEAIRELAERFTRAASQ